MYCTYLTLYKGNKLPPFYIGSTSIKRIESGYKGSVSSKKYQSIWKSEVINNPHLFIVMVTSTHNSREEALIKEEYFHTILKVVSNPMYVNCSIARKDGFFGMDVSGTNNPMYGKPHPNRGKKFSEEYRINLSKIIKSTWTEKRKIDQSIRTSGSNNPMYGTKWDTDRKIEKSNSVSGSNNPMYGKNHSSEARKKISEKATGRIVSKETRKRIGEKSKGRKLSEETKKRLSEERKGKLFSDDHKKNISIAKKELAEIKVCCIFCKKVTSVSPWKRFHGEKCKLHYLSESIFLFKPNG